MRLPALVQPCTDASRPGGLLVPADRYYGRAEEVLARIEAGGQRDGDELELRDRCLELFKIVSKNGVPEVWLLGHQLAVPERA